MRMLGWVVVLGLVVVAPTRAADEHDKKLADFFDATLRGDTKKLDAVKKFASQPGVTTFLAQP